MDNETLNGILEQLDSLQIENQLNTAHLKTLTSSFYEILDTLFSENQTMSLKKEYLHTLYENSDRLLNQPGLNPSKTHKALFELHSFVQNQLRELE
jgi:hypothetical protein